MKIENDSVGARRRCAPRLPESLPPATSIGEESDRALPALSQPAEDNWANEHCANEPGGFFPCGEHNSLWALVPHFINTTTFAARDFGARRGASDAHTLQRSVRSEQRSLGQKEPPPGGLRRFSVLASLLIGHSPAAGDAPSSRLARTENRRNKRGRIYETGYSGARVALVLLLFVASLSSQAAVREVGAIGLTVGDLDREVEFYTKVLPFEKVSESKSAPGAADELLGLGGTQLRSAELKVGEERITADRASHEQRPAYPAGLTQL